MLIIYDYKELNLRVEKCSIDRFLYKKKVETTYYKKARL